MEDELHSVFLWYAGSGGAVSCAQWWKMMQDIRLFAKESSLHLHNADLAFAIGLRWREATEAGGQEAAYELDFYQWKDAIAALATRVYPLYTPEVAFTTFVGEFVLLRGPRPNPDPVYKFFSRR